RAHPLREPSARAAWALRPLRPRRRVRVARGAESGRRSVAKTPAEGKSIGYSIASGILTGITPSINKEGCHERQREGMGEPASTDGRAPGTEVAEVATPRSP